MTVSALFLLLAGNVLAGSEYDKCIREENALKAEESGNCSGFSYIFNPNGCFAAQKALKKYTSTDKCRKIGIVEHVDLSAPPVASAAKPGSIDKIGSVSPVDVKKPEHTLPQQEGTCEQLKEENQRLKAEISRLKTENEQLRKTGQ